MAALHQLLRFFPTLLLLILSILLVQPTLAQTDELSRQFCFCASGSPTAMRNKQAHLYTIRYHSAKLGKDFTLEERCGPKKAIFGVGDCITGKSFGLDRETKCAFNGTTDQFCYDLNNLGADTFSLNGHDNTVPTERAHEVDHGCRV
ncbi:hypothetical protein MMC24_006323 [Lignoscripta atroalba]|nr:hypothetical protein [Lignoscripta atroalba]